MNTSTMELLPLLRQHQQEHLLHWWDELTPDQQQRLAEDIRAIDFDTIQRVRKTFAAAGTAHAADGQPSKADLAAAPTSVVYQPTTAAERESRRADIETGNQLLADGRVAVITVAGGQGTRLGFDRPKGMYPISPVNDRTLFRIFAEQIQARRLRHGGSIPWLIMTSAATHQETVEFFEQHDYLGLDPATVFFFQQGSMPAVAADTGKVLMKDKCTICLSPDGHGGLVSALKASGLLQRLADDGVTHVFYHQVDNPTVVMCDPALIGVHHRHQSQLTTNVVRKVDATERMGVLVEIQGRLEIIEYSDMTEAQAARKDDTGRWIFWAGNTAIHVFSRAFLEQLAAGSGQLQLHIACKKVPHINAQGSPVEPDAPNAHKFERFIFDALPLARNALIVEGNRDREFNPVKNATGRDSPETARAALNRIGHEWLAAAGHKVEESTTVEISPLVALDADELSEKLADGRISVADLVHK